MPEIREVDPSSIVTSEFNERTEVGETDDDSPSLEDSIAEIGIVEPPKVRETDKDGYDYEVVVGQRRVNAALEAGLDTIPVVVGDWSDKEALTMSISENVEGFKNRVSPSDRASALQTLWEMMDGDGTPSSSALARELGVPQPTVNTWIEPLRPEWTEEETEESNEVHYEEEKSSGISDEVIDGLGETTLTEIRNGTETSEEAQEAAERVLEEDFTLSEVKDLRTHLEDGDDLDTAVEKVENQEEGEEFNRWTDFSNLSDEGESEDTEDVEEVEDPTEVTEDPTPSPITQQIQDVEMVEVEVEEGEIDFTLRIPEKTYERAESFGSDFGYETVEELLLIKTIPEFLDSEDGTEMLTEILDEKAKARGY